MLLLGKNTIEGQQNLIDANKKTISLVDTKRNKTYTLNKKRLFYWLDQEVCI
jgi:malate synthase